MTSILDTIEAKAQSFGWRTLRADWNERGDRLYLKVWRHNAVPATFTLHFARKPRRSGRGGSALFLASSPYA